MSEVPCTSTPRSYAYVWLLPKRAAVIPDWLTHY